MKKTLLALSAIVAATALPTAAYADLAFNVGVVSDYRYRGISQSRTKPAFQGGIDYTAGGLYIGTWASTIKWIKDVPGGDAGYEWDIYGGYKGEIVKDLGYDVGVLTYVYPSNKLNPSANTTEIYGALSYGPGTLKYSHAVTNTFGVPDSKNTFYLDASATFDVGGFSVVPHIGYQKFKGNYDEAASYTDYSITVSKDFSGFVPSIAIIGTDADKNFYVPGSNANSTKFMGKTTVVVGLKYNF